MTVADLASEIKEKPMFIHINPIGLLRVANTNEERFNLFNTFLHEVEQNGGNIAIPTYSYSYSKKEVYDIIHTPSELDEVSEYLRKLNPLKRTVDANFSYLLFGRNFSKKHFYISEIYSSFGEGSLIEEVFLKDGYLAGIGGALEYLTEIHYLERLLKVNYRFDKEFQGRILDKEKNIFVTSLIYYCRDLESNYSVSFVQLKEDLKRIGHVKIIKIDKYNLKIEMVRFKDIYEFIKGKILEEPTYLWKK